MQSQEPRASKTTPESAKTTPETGPAAPAAALEHHEAIDSEAMGNEFKAIRNIYADPKMPPRDKRQLIDSIYLQMIDLAKRGNDRFKATEKNFQRSEERAQQLAQ